MNDKLLCSYYLEIREARTFGLQRVKIVKSFTHQRVLNDSFTTGEHDHDEKLSQNNEGSIYLQRSPTPYNSGHKYTLLNKVTFKYSCNT